MGAFLAGRPARANPADRLDPALAAAVRDYIGVLREYVDAVGQLRLERPDATYYLTPPGRVRAKWLPAYLRNNAGRGHAELAVEVAARAREIREAIPEQAERAARERARERDLAAWEGQAYELEVMPRGRTAQGRLVWLYHGTSDALLPSILRQGLLDNPPARSSHSSVTPGYVYLALSAARTDFYCRVACRKHGGEPVLLRLALPWSWTEPDLDDVDIESGRWQRRVGASLPPEHIFEVSRAGQVERVRGPLRAEGEDAWARGFASPNDPAARR
jgi:hypothetical protein